MWKALTNTIFFYYHRIHNTTKVLKHVHSNDLYQKISYNDKNTKKI